jgi:ACS family glucarate transporter-like MFS transporter
MLSSGNMWLAMTQYFCSNFTFFFMLSWLFPYLKKTYQLDPVIAGWYSASTFVAGAFGNVVSGRIIDLVYRSGKWRLSRQLPAMVGFALAAMGVIIAAQMDTVGWAVFWLSVAVFGADMTLAPSWAFCSLSLGFWRLMGRSGCRHFPARRRCRHFPAKCRSN